MDSLIKAVEKDIRNGNAYRAFLKGILDLRKIQDVVSYIRYAIPFKDPRQNPSKSMRKLMIESIQNIRDIDEKVQLVPVKEKKLHFGSYDSEDLETCWHCDKDMLVSQTEPDCLRVEPPTGKIVGRGEISKEKQNLIYLRYGRDFYMSLDWRIPMLSHIRICIISGEKHVIASEPFDAPDIPEEIYPNLVACTLHDQPKPWKSHEQYMKPLRHVYGKAGTGVCPVVTFNPYDVYVVGNSIIAGGYKEKNWFVVYCTRLPKLPTKPWPLVWHKVYESDDLKTRLTVYKDYVILIGEENSEIFRLFCSSNDPEFTILPESQYNLDHLESRLLE